MFLFLKGSIHYLSFYAWEGAGKIDHERYLHTDSATSINNSYVSALLVFIARWDLGEEICSEQNSKSLNAKELFIQNQNV